MKIIVFSNIFWKRQKTSDQKHWVFELFENGHAKRLGVLEVMFTKYCTCARENPGELPELSRLWTGVSSILVSEPYMLKTCLGKKLEHQKYVNPKPRITNKCPILERQSAGHFLGIGLPKKTHTSPQPTPQFIK